MRWRPGELVLDLYEVLDPPLEGGMGLVYRVRHHGWGTDLAVKVPRPEQLTTEHRRGRFETEAGTWVGLGLHPHVVSCAYVRRVDALPCVFAEWVAGGSLEHVVRAGRLRPGADEPGTGFLARALDLAVQSAWGIDHAHRQGLIHQDVKPANIMVDVGDDWTAKVTDFGLAGARAAVEAAAGSGPEASLAASFGGMTPAYCSPEQAEAAAGARTTLTRATDVWSWALCVLEMFAGRRPCRYGQTAREVFADFLAGGASWPDAQPMPQPIVDLLWRCFAVDPSDRPRDLAEVATTITETYADSVGTPYPRVPPPAASLLAGSLSNQALSLLDLGRDRESAQLWRDAIDIDPHHASAVYNWAVYRWRHGSITDQQVLAELRTAQEVAGDRWQADHLLGFVHAERGDDEAARQLLAGTSASPDVAAAASALAARRTEPDPGRLPGHRGAITAVAVARGGRTAVSGGKDGCLRIWSLAEGRCVRELTPTRTDATAVSALAVAPDGRAALVVWDAGRVELWDLDRGAVVREMGRRHATATAVTLSGSGAAIGYEDGRIEVWDTRRGRLRRRLEHPPHTYQRLDSAGRILPTVHESPAAVTRLGLSEDGEVAVSAAPSDGSVVVWEVDTGRWLHRLVKSADMRMTGVDQVALSPSGEHALLIGHQSGRAHVWETRPNRQRGPVPNSMNRHARLALSGDGDTAVSVGSGGIDRPVRVWETASGRCLRTIAPRHDGLPVELADLFSLTCVAVSADGGVTVVGDEYGGLHPYRLPRPALRAPWSYERPLAARTVLSSEAQVRDRIGRAEEFVRQGMPVRAAEELRSAREVVGFERHPELRARWEQLGRTAGQRSDLLGIWQRYELRGGTFTFVPGLRPALGADGELAVTGGVDGLVRVWELQTGRQLLTFPERAGKAHTVVLAADARLALTADWGGTAHLWDLPAGKRRAELHGDQGAVRAADLARAGEYAIVGDDDGALCLWRARSVHLVRTMVAHQGRVGSVRLSDDGRFAASAGAEDRTCRLWRTGTGSPLLTVPVGIGPVALRFTPDNRHLLVNSTGKLTVWDVFTGRRRYERESWGDALAVSRDGRVAAVAVLSTEHGRVLSAWETATGRTLCDIASDSDVFDVSPDGRYVVTADRDRVLRIWDTRTGRRVHECDGHPEPVSSVTFTEDGRNLVSVDDRPAIRLWELDWDYDVTS
ncbi:protein kinase [Micromonospora sp. WMMD1120]|uniref:protein kinase domain-containing protein n=1 Tax=Micromonospora sp. WMMD1120 TaxID=3016106 RepID=UPI00241784FE|nr:protein kinase [Micromonospora sp. WMMD1120]MDG4805585.1 protein kinase [Micromonospora sp. WMMD1120]